MNNDIDQVVQQRATCQEHPCSQQGETLQIHEIPTRPWQIVGTDLFFFDGHDHFPLGSQTVVNPTKQMFSEHGIPQCVVSDNGPQYDSETYRKSAKEWNFDHITSSPHYERLSGFIERSW